MRPVSAFLAVLLLVPSLGVAMGASNDKTTSSKAKSSKSTSAKPTSAKSTKPITPPDPRVWTLARGDDTYVLRFAPPRDPDPAFAVTCQPSAKLLQIAIEVEGKPFASGDGVPLSLINGKRRLELAATAFFGSSDGKLVVEAAVALEPRVFDLFRAGDTLVARMPAAQPKTPAINQTYPLGNARNSLTSFENACLARR